jgi:myo-inositol catabolism protein IolC
MLAFDHRSSITKDLLGIDGQPAPEERERICDAKQVIFEGFERAVAVGRSWETAGLLVDEEYGAEVARSARAAGFVFAMPVDKSGQAEFDFEFGEAFGEHIDEFDPTFAKVLVRYNPAGDPDLNRRQARKLRRLSDWLRDLDRKLLFELLVPAESAQLESVGGDVGRYDREIRPAFVVAAIDELQRAGVEPDIWKIEGLAKREHCRRVAQQARAGGRDSVACVVLGRGASVETVAHWLRQGAGVHGYVGFAVGRTLWLKELTEYLAGRLTRTAAAQGIARNYQRMIEIYVAAEAGNAALQRLDPRDRKAPSFQSNRTLGGA